jgi:hypothetical protein
MRAAYRISRAVQSRDVTARHEPTLTAAARSQMTTSSPLGIFSQAELADEVGIAAVSPGQCQCLALLTLGTVENGSRWIDRHAGFTTPFYDTLFTALSHFRWYLVVLMCHDRSWLT